MAEQLPPSHAARQVDAWQLLVVVSALGSVLLVRGPLRDPDVFWHTLAGQYTLDGMRFPHPDPWSFTLPDAHWHTTAWLSEAVLALVYNGAGLAGLVGLRLALLLILLLALHRLLVQGWTGWSGPVAFTVVALPLTSFVQERPQTVSLIFCCWLAARSRDVLFDGRLPRRWSFVALTWIWALFHGLFVLAPGCLLLLALGTLLDGQEEGRKRARHLVGTALLALAAAALTPMGPRLLLAPFTVAAAAQRYIAEWAPTRLTSMGAWGFAGLTAILVVAWSRSGAAVARSQLLWVLTLDAFAFSANRNAAPVAILLAPVAATAMANTWSTVSTIRVSRRLLAVSGFVGLLVVSTSYATAPALSTSQPRRIATVLAEQPGVLRVLDDYNVSGYLLREAWPHIRVAVDGRADRYGDKELVRYSDAVNGRPGWQAYVSALRPDAAVLQKEAALSQLLVEVDHWQVVRTEGSWQLIAPPQSPLLVASTS